MKAETVKLVRGSGNVFRDLGRENPDVEQLKVLLAAEIIKGLDRDGLTIRAAQARTGFAAADFHHIREADSTVSAVGALSCNRLLSTIQCLDDRTDPAPAALMMSPSA